MPIRPTHRLCVLNTIIELVFLVLREFGSFLSAKIVSIQPYFSSALLATKIIDLFAIAKNMLKEFPLVKSANSLGCLIKRYLSNTDFSHNKQKKRLKAKRPDFRHCFQPLSHYSKRFQMEVSFRLQHNPFVHNIHGKGRLKWTVLPYFL